MTTLLWIVGLLGGGGLTLVIVGMFVPAVALALMEALAFLKSLFSFFKTPVGQAIAVALIVVVAFIAGEIHRRGVDVAEWKANEAKVAAEAHQRDADQAAASDADQQQRIAALQAQHQEDEDTINAYEKTLQSDVSHGACALGPGDLHGL